MMVAVRVQVFHIPLNFFLISGKGDREFRILIGMQCDFAWEIVVKTGNSLEKIGNLHSSNFCLMTLWLLVLLLYSVC